MQNKMQKAHNRVIIDVVSIILIIVCEIVFFRSILLNEALIGDAGDGRFTTLVAEHWFRAFSGKESITDLAIFYPSKNVIGYSDILFVFGILHSLFRVFGMNMYQAYKLVIILIHLFGSFTLYYLFRRVLKIQSCWALCGVITFSYSTLYAIFIIHTQLVAVSILPLFLVFVCRAAQNIDERKKRNVYLCFSIVTIELVLYTAWYIAFFSALFTVIIILIWIVVALLFNRMALLDLLSKVVKIGLDWILYALLAVGMAIPFVLLELPLLKWSGGHTFEEILNSLPNIQQAFRIAPEDWLSWNLLQLFGTRTPIDQSGELFSGFPVFPLFTIVIIIIIFLICHHMKNEKQGIGKSVRTIGESESWKSILYISLLLSILISILLVIRFGNNVSLWYIVYSFFPGARSIRAVSRLLLFIQLPMGCAIAVLGNELSHLLNGVKNLRVQIIKSAGMALLVIVLFVSFIRTGSFMSAWNAQTQIQNLAKISSPPDTCKVFAVVDSSENSDFPVFYHLFSFEVADYYDIKTINGYSGVFPEGWDGIYDIKAEGYVDAVKVWAKNHKLNEVYFLDIADGTWERLVF